MSFVFLWPIAVAVAAPRSSAQPITLDEAGDSAADWPPAWTRLCDGVAVPLPASPGRQARFFVRRSGELTVNPAAPGGTIAFERRGLARVQRPGNRAPLACGPVSPATVYDVSIIARHAAATAADGDALLTVLAFASVDPAEKYLVAHREKALADLRQFEREGVHALPELRRLVTTARAGFLLPTDDRMDQLDDAADVARRAAIAIVDEDECKQPASDQPLLPAVCDEALALTIQVTALKEAAARIKAIGGADATAKVVGRQKAIAAEKLLDVVAALAPGEPLSPAARAAQCARIQRYRWLADPAPALRLSTVVGMPLVDEITVAAYGQHHKPAGRVRSGVARTLVVTGIPYRQEVTFATVQGERVTLTPQSLVSALVAPARASLVSMTATPPRGFLGLTSIDAWARTMRHERAAMTSVVCTGDGGAPVDDGSVTVDWELPASSGLEHRAHVFRLDDRDHKLAVALCAGAECTGKEDDKQVKTRVVLTPSRQWTWTLLAEVSAGAPFLRGTELDGGLDATGAPEFQPVLGNQGPDQVYELRRRRDPQDVVSTSLLLGLRVTDDLLVAVGPSLTVGASGSLFKQWNVRLGRQVADGVLFTAGASVRAVPYAQDYAVGERVSVPRGMTTKPPEIRTDYLPVWQLEIGLAFDLTGVAGLPSDIYKVLGGK